MVQYPDALRRGPLISDSGFTDKADFEENPDEGLNLGFYFGVGWTF